MFQFLTVFLNCEYLAAISRLIVFRHTASSLFFSPLAEGTEKCSLPYVKKLWEWQNQTTVYKPPEYALQILFPWSHTNVIPFFTWPDAFDLFSVWKWSSPTSTSPEISKPISYPLRLGCPSPSPSTIKLSNGWQRHTTREPTTTGFGRQSHINSLLASLPQWLTTKKPLRPGPGPMIFDFWSITCRRPPDL